MTTARSTSSQEIQPYRTATGIAATIARNGTAMKIPEYHPLSEALAEIGLDARVSFGLVPRRPSRAGVEVHRRGVGEWYGCRNSHADPLWLRKSDRGVPGLRGRPERAVGGSAAGRTSVKATFRGALSRPSQGPDRPAGSSGISPERSAVPGHRTMRSGCSRRPVPADAGCPVRGVEPRRSRPHRDRRAEIGRAGLRSP